MKKLLALLVLTGAAVVGSVSARCGSCHEKPEVIVNEGEMPECAHTVEVKDPALRHVEVRKDITYTCPANSTIVR